MPVRCHRHSATTMSTGIAMPTIAKRMWKPSDMAICERAARRLGMADTHGRPGGRGLHSRVLGAGACIFSNGRRSRGGRRTRKRAEGVGPGRVAGDYPAKGLGAQAWTWGAPLLSHLTYARRSTIFRGVRGMWAGLEGSGLIDHKLVALLN